MAQATAKPRSAPDRSGHQPGDEVVADQPTPDDRAARPDGLLTRANQAAQRVAAQQTERQARSEYAARIEREAQTEPEAGQQAEARDGADRAVTPQSEHDPGQAR